MNDAEQVIEQNTEQVTDDLDTFSKEFYGETPEVEAPEEKVEDVKAIEEETDLATEDEADTEEPETPKPKRKSPEDRIKEVVTKQRQAERDLAEALAKIEELSSPKAPAREPVQQELPFGLPDPNSILENGDPEYPLGEFDPKYAADLAKAMFKEQMAEFKAEQQREREEAQMRAARETVNQAWQAKVVEAEASLPDLREKVSTLDEITSTVSPEKVQYLADTIMAMDAGPEVLYYLADNPDEAERIVAADPRSAALLLGRLEGVILSGKPDKADKKRVTPTSAPTPPALQTRGASGKFDISDDTDDLTAFEKKFYKK